MTAMSDEIENGTRGRDGDRQSIVWWCIDSVRQDRCSAYGYERETTPNLEALESLDCRSNGYWSLPSATSILTASRPDVHGVIDPKDFLPRDSVTVPERLSDAGYHTIGIAANPWVSRRKNLDMGFDEFFNLTEDNLLREVEMSDILYFLTHIRSVAGGFTLDRQKHRTEWLLLALAQKKLREAPTDEPIFMYLHTEGVHSIYDDYHPPPKQRGRLSGSGTSRTDRYDDLLSWVDSLVPRFLSAVPEEATTIVTSDHGELLGEDGEWFHRTDHPLLYEVPLFLKNFDLELDRIPVDHVSIVQEILMAALGRETFVEPSIGERGSTSDGEDESDELGDRLSALGYK